MYNRTTEIIKEPDVYYDGCVSCTVAIEKSDFLIKHIIVRAKFKNETDYPIPIEKRNLFISLNGTTGRMDFSTFEVSRNGKEVEYRGRVIKRPTNTAKYPEDYYTLPPRGECVATVDLSRYYSVRRKGKYSIKYKTWNYVTSIVNINKIHAFKIESDTVYF